MTVAAMWMFVQVDQLAFFHLLAREQPRVAAHLDHVGADVTCLFAQWFLCLFVNTLPMESCLRSWDAMLRRHSVAPLFQVGNAGS